VELLILFYMFHSSNYFPEHKLPGNIVATTNAKDALLGADFCLHAVPVQVILYNMPNLLVPLLCLSAF